MVNVQKWVNKCLEKGYSVRTVQSADGHVTERMREHYSSVRLDEKKEALANVVRLIHRTRES